MKFRLIRDEIEIASAAGTPIWRGRPFGLPVKRLFPLSARDACIVLCDPDAQLCGRFENVMRISGDGSVVWRAALPSAAGDDCYTELGCERDVIVAQSWTGYRVRIAPSDGALLDFTFTK